MATPFGVRVVEPRERAPSPRPIGAVEIFTALVLLGAGCAKLLGLPFMVAAFDSLGAGQWLRYAVALAEIVGALALLSSSFVGFAALALLPIMLGAAMTEVILRGRPPIAALLCIGALVWIARRHWPQASHSGGPKAASLP